MLGHLFRCWDCGVSVGEADRVEEFQVYAQTEEFQRVGVRCEGCAESYAERRTYGEVDAHSMELASWLLTIDCPVPTEVRWIQGDFLSFLVLFRRRSLTPDDKSGQWYPTEGFDFTQLEDHHQGDRRHGCAE